MKGLINSNIIFCEQSRDSFERKLSMRHRIFFRINGVIICILKISIFKLGSLKYRPIKLRVRKASSWTISTRKIYLLEFTGIKNSIFYFHTRKGCKFEIGFCKAHLKEKFITILKIDSEQFWFDEVYILEFGCKGLYHSKITRLELTVDKLHMREAWVRKITFLKYTIFILSDGKMILRIVLIFKCLIFDVHILGYS